MRKLKANSFSGHAPENELILGGSSRGEKSPLESGLSRAKGGAKE